MGFRNLASALVEHGGVRTTLAKAKQARPRIERLVTVARKGDLSARRYLLKKIPRTDIVKKLIEEVGPRFKKRPGGYLRIVKLGPRRSDGAEMARLEWVEKSAKLRRKT